MSHQLLVLPDDTAKPLIDAIVSSPEAVLAGWAPLADRFQRGLFYPQEGHMAPVPAMQQVLDAARGEVIWIKEIPRGEGLRPSLIVHEYETLRLLGGTGPHVLQVHELFAGESAMAFSSERLVGTALDLHAGAGALDLTRAQRLFAPLAPASPEST